MRNLFTTLAILFYFSLSANAKKLYFPCTTKSDAHCKAELKMRNDGNNHIKLRIEDLPRPWELEPPKPSYIIWLQEPDNDPVVQSVLIVDKDLKAQFKTTIRSVNFTVFVTAEEEVSPRTPHGPSIIEAKIKKSK